LREDLKAHSLESETRFFNKPGLADVEEWAGKVHMVLVFRQWSFRQLEWRKLEGFGKSNSVWLDRQYMVSYINPRTVPTAISALPSRGSSRSTGPLGAPSTMQIPGPCGFSAQKEIAAESGSPSCS
jgi:hypothetical protein